jgi:hypothetical protein
LVLFDQKNKLPKRISSIPENVEVVYTKHALEYRVLKRFADAQDQVVFEEAIKRFIHNTELLDWVVQTKLKVIFTYKRCQVVLRCEELEIENKIIVKIITRFHKRKSRRCRRRHYSRPREKKKVNKILRDYY